MEVSVLTLSTPSVVHFGDTYQAVRIHMGPPGELKATRLALPCRPLHATVNRNERTGCRN